MIHDIATRKSAKENVMVHNRLASFDVIVAALDL